MAEAMPHGWRAQQKARGLQDATIEPRERLVRAFMDFTSEYPWNWGPGHVEEWTLSPPSWRTCSASTSASPSSGSGHPPTTGWPTPPTSAAGPVGIPAVLMADSARDRLP